MKLTNIGAKRFLFVAAAVIALGVIALFGASLKALSELRVGGPTYTSIVLGKDLIADILPPPEYIIESYLETTLALQDPANADAHIKRLAQLRKDYDDRHTYWLDQDFDAAIKAMMVTESHEHVARYWTELDTN